MKPEKLSMRRCLKRHTRTLRAAIKMLRILMRGHGHLASLRDGVAVDCAGLPVPWFTYPAIEFLRQLDFSTMSIFEFGSGQSTLFWEQRARRVVSVESNEHWYASVKGRVGPRVTLTLANGAKEYAGALSACDGKFDVIVVDGVFRAECCEAAGEKLNAGGMVILDNSERYPELAARLRAAGLLQVDMNGFGPVNDYTWTTSFFFHREFDFPCAGAGRPQRGVGSIPFASLTS
jgi:hypothetical protein